MQMIRNNRELMYLSSQIGTPWQFIQCYNQEIDMGTIHWSCSYFTNLPVLICVCLVLYNFITCISLCIHYHVKIQTIPSQQRFFTLYSEFNVECKCMHWHFNISSDISIIHWGCARNQKQFHDLHITQNAYLCILFLYFQLQGKFN